MGVLASTMAGIALFVLLAYMAHLAHDLVLKTRKPPEIDPSAIGQVVLRIGDEQLTLVDSSQDWTRGMLWLSLQNVEQFERASTRPRPTPREA